MLAAPGSATISAGAPRVTSDTSPAGITLNVTVSYSLSFFFHFIPGTVETLTRFPAGAPYLANPDDPKAQPIIGFFFVLFLVGATLQVLRLRVAPRTQTA